MLKKFFTINIKNESIDFSSEFCLVDNIGNFLIAEDFSGNKIIFKDSLIFLYIHDKSEELEYTKIFNNIEDFYKITYFYDEEESNKRYDDFINEYRKQTINDSKEIPEKELYISTVIKYIGGKRILEKYKNGSHYNITQAYLDGELTEEEFKKLFLL